MKKSAIGCWAILVLSGCGAGQSSSDGIVASNAQPVLSGDACGVHATQATCDADTSDGCHWVELGLGCPVFADGGSSCPGSGGLCIGPSHGGGGCGLTAAGGGPAVPGVPVSTNPCTAHNTSSSCDADTTDHCYWFASACPAYRLPDGGLPECNGGVCVQEESGSCDGGTSTGGGGASDAGTISAACGCAIPMQPGSTGAEKYVCVEQVGGPAVQNPPVITCDPLPVLCNSASLCDCIVGQGACKPSASVSGLCICDNGLR